ncbi:MAG TPA: hypothetical protein VFR94_04440 [Nitrososphaeraceae archaeon]|nr:hypothetical protein [Nitrososphaeraceae archaeon]
MLLIQTTSGSELWETSAKSMMTVPRVKKVWDKQRIKQLIGTIAAITVFEIFLVKWNSTLENEAKKRAQQLYESERKARELENSYDAVKQYIDEVLEELRRKPVHSRAIS